jgi:poly-gamma-glutamate synthesis protein (capsule biosynthesis protein)
MMFDRTTRTAAVREGYPFLLEPLEEIFDDHNLIVANLEGPVTHFSSVSVGSVAGEPNNTHFTFSPEVGALLSDLGMVVNVGNNHIRDFGSEGVLETQHVLEQNNVEYFGDTGGEVPDSLIHKAGRVSVGLVSFNQFLPGSFARAKSTLLRLGPHVDFLILYAHWGDEYKRDPTEQQRQWAHAFVDVGADLIVGSHSHVVQSVEEYRGVPIYYSLGNLVFDQFWDKSVQCGALLSVQVTDNKLVRHTLIPVRLDKNHQTYAEACT